MQAMFDSDTRHVATTTVLLIRPAHQRFVHDSFKTWVLVTGTVDVARM